MADRMRGRPLWSTLRLNLLTHCAAKRSAGLCFWLLNASNPTAVWRACFVHPATNLARLPRRDHLYLVVHATHAGLQPQQQLAHATIGIAGDPAGDRRGASIDADPDIA